jgi:type VI secretion system protein ImpK
LKPPAVASQKPAVSPPKRAGASLGEQLSEAIGRRDVEVLDVGGAAVIVLKADQLFASGSARLDAGLRPLILRIAETLDRIPGAIVVTGHTDDVPIRTARFPSNWELSAERARSVSALMATRLREQGRLRAEGVADSEPLAANDGSANRARNRRVAIILRTAS